LGGNGAGIRDQNTDPSAKLIIQHSLFTGGAATITGNQLIQGPTSQNF
jgi:hypothetical protein